MLNHQCLRILFKNKQMVKQTQLKKKEWLLHWKLFNQEVCKLKQILQLQVTNWIKIILQITTTIRLWLFNKTTSNLWVKRNAYKLIFCCYSNRLSCWISLVSSTTILKWHLNKWKLLHSIQQFNNNSKIIIKWVWW